MSGAKVSVTPQQKAKETAILKAIVLDTGIMVFMSVAGLLSGSITALSEIIRIILMLAIEYATFAVLRRSHRGGFSEFDFGTGKIERITNLLVAFGLIMSSFYIFSQVVSVDAGAPISTTHLMLTIVAGTLNLMINYYCTIDFIRANRVETSVIVSSQIAARLAKTVASAVVLGVLMLTLWLPDPKAARIADVLGSLFIVGYMLVISYGLIKESLPEILDRTVPEPDHFQILRILVQNMEAYDGFTGYKARRSGKDLFILVQLGYDPAQTMAQVSKRLAVLRQAFEAELPGSIITLETEAASLP